MSILVLCQAPEARAQIVAALRDRGVDTVEAADMDAALEVADHSPVSVVLVEPEILISEPFDIGARLGVRTSAPVRVVALTHLADPARKKAFQVHDADLLPRPVDDFDALADAARTFEAAIRAPRKPEPTVGKLKVERLTHAPGENLDAPPRPDGQPVVAVVVDDDEGVRSLLTDILTPRGYQVETFASANAALRWLNKNGHAVSIILSDLRLPQMDGFELKSSLPDSAAGAPYLVVSSLIDKNDEEVAKGLGITGLVSKPLQARALCKLVRDSIIGNVKPPWS